jgi:hypothetical protein
MTSAEDDVESRLTRVLYTAGLIGTVGILGLGVGISLLGGTTFIDALGIGAFAALWGGPGFGGMAGGIYYVSHEDARRRKDAAQHH